MDFKYENLRPMDVVCTSSKKAAGKLIRLWTARLKGFNGLKEMFQLNISNHIAVIVESDGRYWLAEMLSEGLQGLNSMKKYLKDPDTERITSIVRLPIFDSPDTRKRANGFLLDMAQEIKSYDWKGCLGAFLNITTESPKDWYCSEMAEIVANRHGASWDAWQLKRSGKKKRIAPVEIEYGSGAVKITDWLEK